MKAEAVQPLLVLLQLGRRARSANDLASLGFVMVNETRQLIPYRQAACWLGGALGRVAAVSGLPEPAPTAPYTQWLGQLFRALRQSPSSDSVRMLTAADLPPAIAAEWADWLPSHLLWMPLRRSDGRVEGGLILAGDAPWAEHEKSLADELANIYGHALAVFAPRQRLTERIIQAWKQIRYRRLLIAGVILLILFPVRLTVLAPAEVVPHKPFLVRAPLDGVIDEFLVQPNQTIKPGDALFSLDATALQTRHAVARKAYDAAQEEYRQSAQLAVSDDKGKLDMALRRGALEEKSIELAYTSEQLGRVQVKAEQAGVAVFADVNDWLGKAVILGEKVLTLADPQQVELVVQLAVADSIDVKPGVAITLYPNGTPLRSFDAELIHAAYHAEPMPDGRMVYRLKARFTDNKDLPRIGLMGTAKVYGGWAPLGYYALRRPLTSLRQWLGW